MGAILANVLKKFGKSLLKGAVAVIVIGVTAASGALPTAFTDLPESLRAPLIAGLTALLAALVSAINRLVNYDPLKDK